MLKYTYRVIIDGFCKTGNVTRGYSFLLENIEKGFIPSLTTFGRVLNCLCVEHKVQEAVGIIHLMVQKDIVPDTVNTIFEADKKVVAAPKIVVENLLKKGHITYHAYELLYDGIRDKTIFKKSNPNWNSLHRKARFTPPYRIQNGFSLEISDQVLKIQKVLASRSCENMPLSV
ncbi:putative pentatricopeptide repeat-containing protein At1g74580 [Vicia villosa]|uniref:putative pentatricopeptide repeat-containing protein At1g74580 n=1 Tax=Vicia villosa TaxID=3911 RepID=UPI00273C55D9|nr:putative pentatricopeptide repeat-containing protein At1g74580 [Vicia villosa]